MSDTDDLKLPNINIHIVRRGDMLKFKAGKYTLELKEIPNKSQTYPLLLLDKFLSEVTTLLLKDAIERQKTIEELDGLLRDKKAKDSK